MSKKILLADDSITIQKVIELTFSDEDFEVVTVGNGRLAIERVQDVRPDLVLCDIIMPEKDGYEVCEFIKKTPALARTPVLLLTGAFEPFDQERATRVGCDGFLAKPFEPQTLIAKVKDLLGKVGAGAAPAPAASTASTASGMAPAAAPAPPAPAPEPRAAAAPAPVPEPEPFAFVPEPPTAYEPPPAPVPFEEAGVSFFPEDTFEEVPDNKRAAATPSSTTVPVPTFPEAPDFEEYRASAFDEVPPASPAPVAPAARSSGPSTPPPAPVPPPPAAAAGRAGFPALDEVDGPQTLLHVSADEMATLRGEPARPTPPPPPPPPSPAPAAAAPP
jgi:CheY-like chemotaxis protein